MLKPAVAFGALIGIGALPATVSAQAGPAPNTDRQPERAHLRKYYHYRQPARQQAFLRYSRRMGGT